MGVCIEFQDVSYAYPLTKKAAVRHLNCKLETGKCYGVIGPNAGGKTTFCNLMRGLCPNFYGGILKGSVLVNGKNLLEWEDEELSVQVGYVFQDPFAQVSGIKETVFEEIGMGLENLGMEAEEMIARIVEIAKMVHVDMLLQKNPLALSGGQCQRVAFASILALDSDIIVIDEPTSQLDPESSNDVFEIIDLLKRQGKTVIIAEHKVDLLAEYCDEIIAIAGGSIIAMGGAKEVLSDAILRDNSVRIPQVVSLALELEKAGKAFGEIPITMEETITMLKERMKEGRSNGN